MPVAIKPTCSAIWQPWSMPLSTSVPLASVPIQCTRSGSLNTSAKLFSSIENGTSVSIFFGVCRRSGGGTCRGLSLKLGETKCHARATVMVNIASRGDQPFNE